ncbi:hypothetical protein FKM82_026962 [Ascaphus truei]
MAVSFSIDITSSILLITEVLEGALICFQAAAIEHLAAVSMAMMSLDIGEGTSSIGLFSTRVSGSRGKEIPVTPKISAWIMVQNLCISGHDHQMWAMSPFSPHPRQQRSSVPG